MQDLQPQLKAIQNKYKNKTPQTRQKLQQETMALYKEAGVNPIGCLGPLVIQMPIWIGLYRAILKSAPSSPEGFVDLSKYFYSWNSSISKIPFDSNFIGIDLVDFHSPPVNPTFVLSENIYQRGWIVDKDKGTGWGDGANGCQITVTMGPEEWEPFKKIETLIGTLEDNFDECNQIANQLGRGILKGDVILLGSMFPPHPVNMSDFEVSMNGSKISLRFVP